MELFLLKMLDNVLSTLKNIFLYKNKIFLSALLNSLATGLYLLIIVRLTQSNNINGILLVCLATFLGTFFAGFFAGRLEKDAIWIFDILPDNNQNGKDLADKLRGYGLEVLTYQGYNHNKEKVLCSKVYSQSKKQSRLIESFIPHKFSYSVIEVKNTKIRKENSNEV